MTVEELSDGEEEGWWLITDNCREYYVENISSEVSVYFYFFRYALVASSALSSQRKREETSVPAVLCVYVRALS